MPWKELVKGCIYEDTAVSEKKEKNPAESPATCGVPDS